MLVIVPMCMTYSTELPLRPCRLCLTAFCEGAVVRLPYCMSSHANTQNFLKIPYTGRIHFTSLCHDTTVCVVVDMEDGVNKQDLDAVVEGGESDRVEFTECPAGKLKADKVGKTICAFANGSGGRLFLGISDKGTDKIKGFATTNEQMGNLYAYADKLQPSIPVSSQKIPLDSRDKNTLHVVVISVEEGDRKPYSYNSRFFKRFGASTREMPPDEVLKHMAKTGLIKFDREICAKFNYPEHFDRKKLASFLDKTKHEHDVDDVVSLKKLGVVYSTSGSKVTFNNAGALLFAKNLQEIYLHTEIACAMFSGREETTITDPQEFNSDIISNIEEALLYLKKNLRTVYRYVPGQAQMEEALEIPEEALREAVVNAVTHRDYLQDSGRVTVEIYQNRVKITNLGGLPKEIKLEDLGKERACHVIALSPTYLGMLAMLKNGALASKRYSTLCKRLAFRPLIFNRRIFFP